MLKKPSISYLRVSYNIFWGCPVFWHRKQNWPPEVQILEITNSLQLQSTECNIGTWTNGVWCYSNLEKTLLHQTSSNEYSKFINLNAVSARIKYSSYSSILPIFPPMQTLHEISVNSYITIWPRTLKYFVFGFYDYCRAKIFLLWKMKFKKIQIFHFRPDRHKPIPRGPWSP